MFSECSQNKNWMLRKSLPVEAPASPATRNLSYLCLLVRSFKARICAAKAISANTVPSAETPTHPPTFHAVVAIAAPVAPPRNILAHENSIQAGACFWFQSVNDVLVGYQSTLHTKIKEQHTGYQARNCWPNSKNNPSAYA